MFVFGDGQNDNFEVNFNRARLYLHGGTGDDRFLLQTFLVLRENASNADEITNLSEVFGGSGSNRYEYLESGPVVINGGPGDDTLILERHADLRHLRCHRRGHRGAGRRVIPRLEGVEIFGAGGDDQIYVLSTSEQLTSR
jgi:Ca2+-binding RTX toxin-like protein